MTVLRIDASTLSAPERTEEGYVRAEGIIASPGVLEYRTKDGDTVKEYVPAKTLRDPAFLESLEDKPVTLEHPDEPVSPDNVSDLSVGNIRDPEWVEGKMRGVKGKVVLQDRKGIEAFESGTNELSPAYEVDLEERAGKSEHGEYDRIQSKRRAANHVALTTAGRAGAKARLRADSDAVQAKLYRADAPDNEPDANDDPKGDTMPQKVRLDSERTVKVDEQTAQILRTYKQDQEDEQLELSSEIESAQSSIEDFKATIEELEGERDELQKKIERKKKQLEKLADKMGLSEVMGGGDEPATGEGTGEPARDAGGDPTMPEDSKLDSAIAGTIDELCRERMDALQAAEAVGLEVDKETPTTDIKSQVVDKYFGDRSPDRADSAQVDAHFNAAVDMIEERTEEREESIESANKRTDSTDETDPDARQQYRDKVFG